MSELARLKWRCRRGVRELDIVLSSWLEQHYAEAGSAARAAFAELLALDDPTLFDLLFGHAEAATPAQREVVAVLRRIARA